MELKTYTKPLQGVNQTNKYKLFKGLTNNLLQCLELSDVPEHVESVTKVF